MWWMRRPRPAAQWAPRGPASRASRTGRQGRPARRPSRLKRLPLRRSCPRPARPLCLLTGRRQVSSSVLACMCEHLSSENAQSSSCGLCLPIGRHVMPCLPCRITGAGEQQQRRRSAKRGGAARLGVPHLHGRSRRGGERHVRAPHVHPLRARRVQPARACAPVPLLPAGYHQPGAYCSALTGSWAARTRAAKCYVVALWVFVSQCPLCWRAITSLVPIVPP